MSTVQDLMGLGMPPLLASRLGANVGALTCTGTSATTAATLSARITNLTAASSQTGAILPTGASLGTYMVVSNTSSTTAIVYPPTSAAFNLSSGTSISVAQYKTVIFYKYSETLWFTVLTA